MAGMAHLVTEVEGENGLQKLRLQRSSGASCEVYVYGAHVTSWCTPDGKEQLMVSSTSEFAKGKAIRGGIPICWPQFAARGPLGKHGFARNSDGWKVRRTVTKPNPSVTLELTDNDATQELYPFSFKVNYKVTLDADDQLTTSMEVINQSEEPMDFTTALHTYFSVSDVCSTSVGGLRGIRYEDNTEGGKLSDEPQSDDLMRVVGEVDRVYIGAPDELCINDGDRKVSIRKTGFPDAVVWNIGEKRCGELKDLAPGEWRQYVCVEAGAIGTKITIQPDARWDAEQTFRVSYAASQPKAEAAAEVSDAGDGEAAQDGEEEVAGMSAERLNSIKAAFDDKARGASSLTLERAYKIMFDEGEKGIYSYKDFLSDTDSFQDRMADKEHLTWPEIRQFFETLG